MNTQSIPIKVVEAFLREELKQRFETFLTNPNPPKSPHGSPASLTVAMDVWRWWVILDDKTRQETADQLYNSYAIKVWIEKMARWADDADDL